MRRALITLFGGMTALLLLAGCSDKGADMENSATDTPAAVSFATDGHFQLIAGCHGNRPGSYSVCDKMKTKVPGEALDFLWDDR